MSLTRGGVPRPSFAAAERNPGLWPGLDAVYGPSVYGMRLMAVCVTVSKVVTDFALA
jgi:hypothetical protein